MVRARSERDRSMNPDYVTTVPVDETLGYAQPVSLDIQLPPQMPNEIFIPDQFSNSSTAKIFNKTISNLSKIVKYFV